MPRTPNLYSLWWLAGPLVVALACSHDSPRDNPLDPKLTPPVDLQVALDDSAGTATLTWTRYEGTQPFAEYLIQRRIADRVTVDTLERIDQVTHTTFVDTSLRPGTAYEYRVSVANASGYNAQSAEYSIQGYSIRALHLLPLAYDRAAGEALVTWTKYRDPGFESYEVRRRPTGTDQDSVLATIIDVDDTTFADTTPFHEVEYLYTAVVLAADQELTSNARGGRLVLPEVDLADPELDSATASAELSWTPYAGPRLRSYRVLRSTAGQIPQVVAEIEDRRVTSFVDTGLVGSTEYFYHVVVVTTRGEEAVSAEASGLFHRQVAEWPLDVEEGGSVRLYAAPGGRIAALVAGQTRVRLLMFGPAGEPLTEQTLIHIPHPVILPQSVEVVLNDEEILLSLGVSFSHLPPSLDVSHLPGHLSVLRFDTSGHPIVQEHALFADFLAALPDAAVLIDSSVSLRGNNDVFVDGVRVVADTDLLFADDFEDGDISGWSAPTDVWVLDGTVYGGNRWRGHSYGKSDPAWQRFLLQVDVGFFSGSMMMTAGALGQPGHTAFFLEVTSDGQVRLTWRYTPSPGSGEKSQLRRFSENLSSPVITGLVNRISLGVADNRPQATIAVPTTIWHEAWDDPSPWVSLVNGERRTLLMTGRGSDLIVPGSEDLASVPLETPVSSMRLWERDGQPHLGVCKPETHRIVVNETGIPSSGALLDFQLNRERSITLIGGSVGQGAGEFLFPLSFDAGPDGRIFVLDTGNGRIQVFDPEGNYITQWGKKGTGRGEFDFGGGSVPEDFAGSICVDDEGYIYVADVLNQRIQKFAP